MAYTVAHHEIFQVRSIRVLVRSLAPITPHDDERTPHAKLYTPRRFHLLRGVRSGVPHPHVRTRWPDVGHRRLEPLLRAREPYHRVRRQLPGDRDGSAQRWRPVPRAHHCAGWLAHLRCRPHRPARPPGDRPVPPLWSVHRWAFHPEPAEGPAPTHRVRRDRPEYRASGRHAAGALRQL